MNEGGNTMSVKILRIQQVAEQTGLSHSSIYKQIRLGLFPRPIKLTARASGWEESAVQAWIEKIIADAEVSGDDC